MDIARIVQYILIGALVVAAVLKSGDAWRASGPQRSSRVLSGLLAAAFWLLAVGQVISLPPVRGSIDVVTGVGIAKIIYNAATVLGLAAVLLFFDRSSLVGRRARQHIVADAVTALVVVVLLAVFMALTPANMRAHSVLHPGDGQLFVMAFYVLGNVWFVWAYLRAGAGALRFVRASSGALAAASGIIATGLLAGALTAALRLGIVSLEVVEAGEAGASVLNEVNFAANNVGLLLDTVGLCVLGLLRLVEGRRRRRLHHHLEPLWLRLNTAFPEVCMPLVPPGDGTGIDDAEVEYGDRAPVLQRERLDYRSVSFDRQLVEVWDGLSRLCQPLNAKVAGRDPSTITPNELAETIAMATSVHPPLGADAAEAPSPELLAVLSGGETDRGLETGADFLAAISQALAHRGNG